MSGRFAALSDDGPDARRRRAYVKQVVDDTPLTVEQCAQLTEILRPVGIIALPVDKEVRP